MQIFHKETQELVQKIKEIGSIGCCYEEDTKFFLPNFPSLGGGEFIFTIGWVNAKNYIDENVWDFVRGLHFIELKYREITNNNFGFGSPSPTEKIIRAVEKTDKEKAKEMREWIAQNGGNYYIPTIDFS